MAKVGISARGERVDFEVLAIKQALASAPQPTSVEARRQFIDTKENSRRQAVVQDYQPQEMPDAMKMALAAAEEAAQSMAIPVEFTTEESSSKKKK